MATTTTEEKKPRTVKTILDSVLQRQTQWPDPLASILQVDKPISTGSSTMGSNKAWRSKGPALQLFDSKVGTEIHALLANEAITQQDAAPIFVRLYMIGPVPEKSEPTVLVCCVSKGLRKDAENCVRRSGILESYGFRLASSAFSLESKRANLE
ncbi:hypothetical protein CTA1_9453 [Colletotrichum tanaceti]|uniref:Uncharacterized protein n=1 Tax=Colletotrichum tanaceti TaxID=1306861 RepID=A0A4U6X4W4_9PEZI|nr:hypothetical protein CTA1_9453 [Colletotrichum tanaceti]